MMYFSVLACIGIGFNVWLYIDDIKNRNGILDKVDTGENLEELMSTPVAENRRQAQKDAMKGGLDDDGAVIEFDGEVTLSQDLLAYKENKEARDTLKRSMAKVSSG